MSIEQLPNLGGVRGWMMDDKMVASLGEVEGALASLIAASEFA